MNRNMRDNRMRDRYDRMDDEYGRDGRHIRFRGSMDSAGYDERYYDGRIDRRNRRDYGDYHGGHGKGMLSNMLCEDMDPQECEMFKFESVIQQAKQMSVEFNKFTEEEFYTTVLMMFTDYCETVGPNIPMYLMNITDQVVLVTQITLQLSLEILIIPIPTTLNLLSQKVVLQSQVTQMARTLFTQ